MPYLRFSRDERGYEHTYLLHGLRSGSRPRLLYWFRTPPNVGIGRLPLDGEAMQAIEDANADLTFDWARMLRVKPKTASSRAGGGEKGGPGGERFEATVAAIREELGRRRRRSSRGRRGSPRAPVPEQAAGRGETASE